MPHFIDINRRFDESLVYHVKQSLKSVPISEKEIYLRINSYGGNMEALRKISGFLYFMQKYRSCNIIGQCIYAESAALDLFINCKIRQVKPGSIGIIHLPVPSRGENKNMTESQISSAIEAKTHSVIKFMKRRTFMTEEQIRTFENFPMGAGTMIKFGIATIKVKKFI